MATKKHNTTAQEVKSSDESCSFEGHSDTAQQLDQARSTITATVKRAVHCVDCGKKFDDWHMLQRHKRKSCLKSFLRFLCRECMAYFPSNIELNNHIAAHTTHICEKVQESKNKCSTNNCKKKIKRSSSASEKSTILSRMKVSDHANSTKWQKVRKRVKKSDTLKNWKSASEHKAAKRVGKLRKTGTGVTHKDLHKAVVSKCTVSSNPFSFTTSCAPDAQFFQFLCQSCLTVRFPKYTELRQHEDWCARVRNSQGFLCLPCGRHYRNLGTLRRHADEYHRMSLSSEVKKVAVNPFRFSTTIALDAASNPYVCSSCLLVCFTSLTMLRRHEDWCGQCVSAKDGLKCNKCGRYFRTSALLERHIAADDCVKTGNIAGTIDDIKISGDTKLDHLVSDIKQKAASETTVHGVCPLCDVPFISQYEQQVHFMNVHNLTSSELKIKQSVEKHSRRGFVRTHITCLDCDLKFSSRLELVQHKRICTKEKEFTKVYLPINPPTLTSGNDHSDSRNICSVEDEHYIKTDNSPRTDVETTLSSASGKRTAKCENLSEGQITESLSSRAMDREGTQRSETYQGLLLNTQKVRNLIRRTSAKQLLLKPDGELVLLGDGGQKISTINGKPVITDISGNCLNAGTHLRHTQKNSVLRNTRSKRSPDTVLNTTYLPASASSNEVEVSDFQSTSEVTNGQQTLLEALQLLPTSSQPNHPNDVTARYRTRSTAHAHVTSSEDVARNNSRYMHNSKDLSRSSSSQKALELSAKTANDTNKTAEEADKQEKTDRKQGDTGSLPQKTQTVEPVADCLVRCVVCETIFRTVRQIVDHICARQ